MSAFVVSTETMDRVVNAICHVGKYGRVIESFAGIGTDAPGAGTEIGRRLFAMNIRAVRQRYGERARDTWTLDQHRTYRHTPLPSPLPMSYSELIDAVKAMDCLAYQCAEGDVPRSRLFKELGAAIGLVSHYIICGGPEYDRAPWDGRTIIEPST